MPQIIGIVLVRNEERFVEHAIRNIVGFCDEVILADHESQDATPEILQRLSLELPQVRFHRLRHPSESHRLLQPYINSPSWVFGVDGDELYEPERLMRFRERLEKGEFDRYWMVLGNALHCEDLDLATGKATGYLAPPSRSMTKFYNFNAITSWGGYAPERLHGGKVVFKPGFDDAQRCYLHDQEDWESACFRCLHLCFIKRSQIDTQSGAVRRNILELYGSSRWQELKKRLLRIVRPRASSDWKKERYRRGERVTVDVRGFFNEERSYSVENFVKRSEQTGGSADGEMGRWGDGGIG